MHRSAWLRRNMNILVIQFYKMRLVYTEITAATDN